MAIVKLAEAAKNTGRVKRNDSIKLDIPESMAFDDGVGKAKDVMEKQVTSVEEKQMASVEDYDFDDIEGLRLLTRAYEVNFTKKEIHKLLRTAKVAQEKVDTSTRKTVDLPNYIDTEVEALLQNIRRKINVKVTSKDYIVSLICRDLISRGVFEDVTAKR